MAHPVNGADGAIIVVCAADADLDGVPDVFDNCPNDPNLDQSNVDGDDAGDACDPMTTPRRWC